MAFLEVGNENLYWCSSYALQYILTFFTEGKVVAEDLLFLVNTTSERSR